MKPRISQIQAALSRGDRRTGLLLYSAYKKGSTTAALRKAEIDGKDIQFYAHRSFSFDEFYLGIFSIWG